MANLNPSAEWVPVYQLETTDPVVGGPPNEATGAGMDNIPHLQLAKRDEFLLAAINGLTPLEIRARLLTVDGAGSGLDADMIDGVQLANIARTDISEAFLAIVDFYGGSIRVRSQNGTANANYFLQDENGVDQGAVYWDRATDTINLRRYAANGITPEGVLSLYANEARINGTIVATAQTAWMKTDAPADLSGTGYQKLPSGLIMQWGSASVANNGVVTFPLAFPNACLNVLTTDIAAGGSLGNMHLTAVSAVTALNFTAAVFDYDGTTASTTGVRWLALGH